MGDTDVTRILLIEDDPTISELLSYNLRQSGYEVITERDGRAGLSAALAYSLDLVIVDVMLPQLDGLSVISEVAKQRPGMPIIVLTARSDRETLRAGFASGADDYITKPFDFDELLLRVEARLRRVGRAHVTQPTPTIPRARLDGDTHVLSTEVGDVFLNPREYGLLEAFMAQPGRLLTREDLMQRVWHQQYSSASRTLDVHVRQLRVKTASVAAPFEISNVRGIGYRLDLRSAGPG